MKRPLGGRWIAKAGGLGVLLALASVFLLLQLSIQKTAGGSVMPTSISREKALEIAAADALERYRDLSGYDVAIEMDGQNWRVDYELKDPTLDGGGPHYIIAGSDGTILQRRYEQ